MTQEMIADSYQNAIKLVRKAMFERTRHEGKTCARPKMKNKISALFG